MGFLPFLVFTINAMCICWVKMQKQKIPLKLTIHPQHNQTHEIYSIISHLILF